MFLTFLCGRLQHIGLPIEAAHVMISRFYRTKGRQSIAGTTITAGLVSSVDFMLDIENTAEDAFQAILSFVVPTNILEFANAFNQTRNGEVCSH